MPRNSSFIVLWKISGALEIPKGRRFMKYFPKGVMNVLGQFETATTENIPLKIFVIDSETVCLTEKLPVL